MTPQKCEDSRYVEEMLQLSNEYKEYTPAQRLQQLLQFKRDKDNKKIALYGMIVYKDILSQRKRI